MCLEDEMLRLFVGWLADWSGTVAIVEKERETTPVSHSRSMALSNARSPTYLAERAGAKVGATFREPLEARETVTKPREAFVIGAFGVAAARETVAALFFPELPAMRPNEAAAAAAECLAPVVIEKKKG